jgi:hypothetical protein
MEGKSTYTECELRYIDQGYDLARVAETCAEAEGRFSHEQKGESSQDEVKEDYWGDI